MRAQDADLFALVARAVIANPFGEERPRIDARIAGVSTRAPWSEALECLLGVVAARLDRLRALRLSDVTKEHRENFSLSVLFALFHEHAEAFDLHIHEQLAQSSRGGSHDPLRVPFAREFIASLVRRGFTEQEALFYLALSFQLRRAYTFVDKSLPGGSTSMRRLRESLWNNVFTHDLGLYARSLWGKTDDFSTLIVGETGSGKGTIAAAIGRSCFIPYEEKRQRFARSFVDTFSALNLSEFSEGLLESELFGHKRGAFTGAVQDHVGVFGRSGEHGSIFLDEIGDVSVGVQVKLLRVLETRTFTPVGSGDSQRFSGRMIAATNQRLRERRELGLFRDDFFYRLSSDVIHVPTLRERFQEDSRERKRLLDVIVTRILGSENEAIVALADAAITRDLPADYDWPGNVRELEQCVRRVILTRHYRGDTFRGKREAVTKEALLEEHARKLYREHGTYGEVARRMDLDWRTVKRYVVGNAG